MARALSLDLRERGTAAIEEGASCREVAKRFSVGTATTIRRHARFRAAVDLMDGAMNGTRFLSFVTGTDVPAFAPGDAVFHPRGLHALRIRRAPALPRCGRLRRRWPGPSRDGSKANR